MKKIIKNNFNNIKLNKKFVIPINDSTKQVGSLLPLTYFDLEKDEIIDKLMIWRNNNIEAYLDRKKVTFEGTRRWLTKYVLGNSQKVLFLISENKKENIKGHVGLANGLNKKNMIEIDNVLRGEKCFNKKLMTHALYDLISWTFISNSIKKLYLRVFSNNQKAIDYYENLNFVIKEQIPLKQNTDDSGNKTYYQAKKGEKTENYFSYMELSRNDHFDNYRNIKLFNNN